MTQEIISRNPANLEEIGRTKTTDPKEISNVVAQLRKKLPNWSQTPLKKRIQIIQKAAAIMKRESDSLAKLMTQEMGKVYAESRGEVDNAAYRLEYFAKTASKALEPLEENFPGIKSVTRFEPIGVIAAIKPWNFPIGIPLWTIIPALLAGNVVLFKPSERTPLLGQQIFEILNEAGLPENVMAIVQGAEEVGKAIVESSVDMIGFVGSQAAGKYIMEHSTHNFRKLALELGSKDPMIICANANFELAVAGAIAGTFKNCGQVCCSSERIYVAQEIFGRFSAALAEKTKGLIVGDGLDPQTNVGPLSHSEELERIESFLKDAVSKGAKILWGGKRIEKKGYFFEPTIITNVTKEMDLLKKEIFGPIMVLVSFKNEEEAVGEANATNFGLTASVWSADLQKADRIAKQLQAGTIAINQVPASIVECPWGGVKGSGIGRMLGPEAVREFTETVNYRYPV